MFRSSKITNCTQVKSVMSCTLFFFQMSTILFFDHSCSDIKPSISFALNIHLHAHIGARAQNHFFDGQLSTHIQLANHRGPNDNKTRAMSNML
eukprot:c17761_g1_i1 orf=303-581(-)